MIDSGIRLREIRLAKGMSQGDFEKRTGILRGYVSRVELGFIVPQLPMLEKWAKALDVPQYRLFLPDDTTRRRGPLARLTNKDKRLYFLLRRMNETDRRLFLSVANAMVKGAANHFR
jgi:transcriptional regulator with XRE-family HTH domain